MPDTHFSTIIKTPFSSCSRSFTSAITKPPRVMRVAALSISLIGTSEPHDHKGRFCGRPNAPKNAINLRRFWRTVSC